MELIKEKILANGLKISFADCSKLVAADRWLVKMRGEVKMPIAGLDRPKTGDGPELLAMIQERAGESVSFIILKERNFIDADEKEAVLADFIDQIEANLLDYLGDPSFPQKLFNRKYDEIRQQCMIEWQQSKLPASTEDEGPADFSACFRD